MSSPCSIVISPFFLCFAVFLLHPLLVESNIKFAEKDKCSLQDPVSQTRVKKGGFGAERKKLMRTEMFCFAKWLPFSLRSIHLYTLGYCIFMYTSTCLLSCRNLLKFFGADCSFYLWDYIYLFLHFLQLFRLDIRKDWSKSFSWTVLLNQSLFQFSKHTHLHFHPYS